MKLWKKIIRVWFTLTSLASFLAGWVILAHAPKPNQFDPANLPALPQLDPIPSLEQVTFSERALSLRQQIQQSQRIQRDQRTFGLRSGGS